VAVCRAFWLTYNTGEPVGGGKDDLLPSGSMRSEATSGGFEVHTLGACIKCSVFSVFWCLAFEEEAKASRWRQKALEPHDGEKNTT